MDGGIDMVYSKHFGWQLQERLQQHLRADYDGELPVVRAHYYSLSISYALSFERCLL